MSDHSELVVALIARALNSCQIPCVLWGHPLLNVHCIPSIVASVDFVLPDHLMMAGANALERLHIIRPCPNPETCLSSSPDRHTPPPARHSHLRDSEVTVGLYLHSQTLWFLPVLDSSLLCPDTSKPPLPQHFTLASDDASLPPWRPGRGSGVFKPDSGPVVVPKAHVLLEAFLRLYARDSAKRVGAFGMAMIGYVELYIDDDGLLDASRLPEPLRTSYMELRQGSKPVRQWTRELKRALQVAPEEGESDEED